jgi:hypothetical protein
MKTQKISYNLYRSFQYVIQELVSLYYEKQWLLPPVLQQELRSAIKVYRERFPFPMEQDVRGAFLRLMQVGLLAYHVRQRSDFVENFSWFLAYLEQVPVSTESADKKVEIIVPIAHCQTHEPTKASISQ